MNAFKGITPMEYFTGQGANAEKPLVIFDPPDDECQDFQPVGSQRLLSYPLLFFFL